MKALIFTVVTFGLLNCFLAFPKIVSAEERIFVTGSDWCPYICTRPDNPQALSENPGYLIELLKLSLDIDEVRYESPSWKRAILGARSGEYDAIIGIYASEAPDLIYSKNAVGISRMCFYVKQNNPWTYQGVESLNEITLGVINGYNYDEGVVDVYIKENKKNGRVESIPGNIGLTQNLRKLLLDRVSAIIDDQQVVEYTNNLQQAPLSLKNAGCLEGIDAHIGFSPANPRSKEYAKKLAQTVEKARQTGKLKALLEKYGISDWK